jgi:multicomponent Na+:H+ antiporter subunit D
VFVGAHAVGRARAAAPTSGAHRHARARLTLVGDPLALLFVTLSAVLWLLTTVYAIGYLEGSPNRSRFFAFFSLCVTATAGIALAGDLFTFIVFYEALTWATYPLVVHRGTRLARAPAGRTSPTRSRRHGAARRRHLAVHDGGHARLRRMARSATSAPSAYGELAIIFVLLVAGLGVKAALVPLHGWLPVAMVAPAPCQRAAARGRRREGRRVRHRARAVQRLRHRVRRELGVAPCSPLAAGVTIMYGSIRALAQDDLKKRLAYSTVSQVSYITLGVATFGPLATLSAGSCTWCTRG